MERKKVEIANLKRQVERLEANKKRQNNNKPVERPTSARDIEIVSAPTKRVPLSSAPPYPINNDAPVDPNILEIAKKYKERYYIIPYLNYDHALTWCYSYRLNEAEEQLRHARDEIAMLRTRDSSRVMVIE